MDSVLDLLAQKAKFDRLFQAIDPPVHWQCWGYQSYHSVNGLSMVSAAAYFGLEKMVQLLIDQGADMNELDSNRESALHHAVRNRHTAIVLLLLQHGANTHTREMSLVYDDYGTPRRVRISRLKTMIRY